MQERVGTSRPRFVTPGRLLGSPYVRIGRAVGQGSGVGPDPRVGDGITCNADAKSTLIALYYNTTLHNRSRSSPHIFLRLRYSFTRRCAPFVFNASSGTSNVARNRVANLGASCATR
jgi:hypothetical protein